MQYLYRNTSKNQVFVLTNFWCTNDRSPRVKTQPELSTETHEISRKAFEAEIESPFRRSAE